MQSLIPILTIISFSLCKVYGVPPVLNYAGQVAVNGEAFEGNGLFKFALVSDNGTSTYWSNDGTSVDGSEPQASISVIVNGGLYSVLLGNIAIQGMGGIDPQVFVQHSDAKLRVWFSDGVNGFQQLSPDRPFASVPYAFSAGNAETAGSAEIANGAVTKSMLSNEVINDLNRKITMNDLDPAVIADLNQSVVDGSIGPSKLSSEVSNVLRPVVIGQPSSVVKVGGTKAYLSVDATGGENTYQWKKDGVDIVEATSPTLSITDLNASQHEGNYTVVVSNAFGSATSSVAQIDVNGSLTEGLVGWWKFDETEGTVASDSSGNGNDGNLTNGPTWTEGKVGGALSFDGVNDLLKLPSTMLNGLTDFSASFHFLENLNNTDHHHFISVANESTANRFILGLESNYEFNIYDSITGASLLNYQSTHNFINWSPIAVSRNSSTTKLFVSGILVSHASHSGDSLTISENGLWVGGDQDSVGGGWSSSQQLNGTIDDLRIYNRALTAFEIKSLHELGEQPVQESGSGTATVVNGTVADGSITSNKLSEQILKYLKPEITQQPTTAGGIFADTNGTISISAEGKYLTYQWKKNGVNLTGETNATLTITDANATLHDGNYSVVVSNDFGSVESGDLEILVTDMILDGLVGWWKFDETDGTIAYDSSGNGNNGNLTNGPIWVTGKIGGALSFDGTDDRLKLPHSLLNGLRDFSMSLYFNESANNTDQHHFLSAANSSNANNFVYGLTASYKFTLNDGVTDTMIIEHQSDHAFPDWSSIIVTRNSTTTKIFVQGELEAQGTHSGNSLSVSNNGLWIGGDQDSVGGGFSGGQQLNGLLDDVRIYNRAISNAEVRALYQLGQ